MSLKVVVPATAVTTGNLNVTTAGGTSNGADFTVTPHITTFTPLKAPGLSNVTINGTGLDGATDVQFDGVSTPHIVSNTPTKIVAQVPNDATFGQITVTNSTETSAPSAASFTPTPAIASFTPIDGKVGTTVTITGAIFTGATAVKFGTISQPTFTVDNPHQITTTVPAGFLTSGKITVVGPLGTGTAISSQTFAITKVTSITASGAAGATVTITGTGLASTTAVDFTNLLGVTTVAPSVPPTATTVKVVVPNDATIGPLTVHTPSTDPTGVASVASFKPLPKITGFESNPNQAGDMVTVDGTNLSAGTAKFGTTSVTVTSPTASSFQFQIPANAVSSTVSFTNSNGTTTSLGKVLVRPKIAGDPDPNEAVAGTKITINGQSFTGTSSVKFGGDTHGALFTVGGGGTTLTVTVPTTGMSGKIQITNAGGMTPTDNDFTLKPFIKSFTPTSAPVGATITVTGTGLLGAEGVMFGGGTGTVPDECDCDGVQGRRPAWLHDRSSAVETSNNGVDAYSDPSTGSLTITFSVTGLSPAVALNGSTVVIHGVGLTGVTSVTFNGISATLGDASLDGTSLNVTVPAGAVSGTVVVHKGTLVTQSPQHFTLLAITGLSDIAGLQGSQVVITGTGFDAVTSVEIGDSAAFTIDSPTQITVTVPDEASTSDIQLDAPAGSVTQGPFTIQFLGGNVVNEVQPGTGGFVELYNGSGSDINLNGAKLVYRPATATDNLSDVVITTFGHNTQLDNGHWLEFDTSALPTAGGGVALETPDGVVVDSVGWGTATNGFVNAAAAVAPPSGRASDAPRTGTTRTTTRPTSSTSGARRRAPRTPRCIRWSSRRAEPGPAL